jgi:hypothetical protein
MIDNPKTINKLICYLAGLVIATSVGCQTQSVKRSNSTNFPGSSNSQAKKTVKTKKQNKQKNKNTSKTAEAKKTKEKPAGAENTTIGAVIGSDGVAVFEDANFDAAVVGYLERGQKVQASSKGLPGKGGFGTFHKISVSGKTVGFVTDVDLVMNQSELPLESTAGPFSGDGPFSEDSEEGGNEGGDPSFMIRKIGGYFGSYNFTETVYKKARTANHYFYGAKLTGPGTYFDGPPIDSNLLVSFTPPSYYSKVTESDPSGFIILADALFMMPLIAWEKGVVEYGAGLMVLFSKYTLPIDGVSVDSQELRLGAVLGLSAAFDLSPKMTLQGDLRYFIEANNYLGFGLSVVTPY